MIKPYLLPLAMWLKERPRKRNWVTKITEKVAIIAVIVVPAIGVGVDVASYQGEGLGIYSGVMTAVFLTTIIWANSE